MDISDATKEPSASEIREARWVPFSVRGTQYFIRPPKTAELDDAETIYEIVFKRTAALENVKDLEGLPMSPDEIESYKRAIEREHRKAEETDEPYKKDIRFRRIENLQTALATKDLMYEVTHNRALAARDRYLCQILLLDSEGHQVFDLKDPDHESRWESAGRDLKEIARPAIWRVIESINDAPLP